MRTFPPDRWYSGLRAPPRLARGRALCVAVAAGLASGTIAHADVPAASDALRRGDYEQAVTLAGEAPREADSIFADADDAAARIQVQALLALGRYGEALARVESALEDAPFSIALRLLGRDAARFAGEPERAEGFTDQLRMLVLGRRQRISSEAQLVDLGEAALVLGAEPRLVLENFLKPAQTSAPPVRRAFLIAGRLALDKGDDGLAARTFEAGLQVSHDDPEMHAGLAAAFLDGDRTHLLDHATRALAVNPHLAAARLLLAEHWIDAEQLDAASAEIDAVLAVNPRLPEAHALRAVIAHLRNDMPAARRAREAALATWQGNPRVDHIIGTKLAQRYRFAESAESLRLAVALDPAYSPARLELAQSLLRLGHDEEGWALALQAQEQDRYSVAAFNLAQLHEQVARMTVLRSPRFVVRMGAPEAPVYGDRAVALLERAHDELTRRYGLRLDRPTTVEIFPDPKDFAVRTFGMPGAGGFLGVCFGHVVTVNSPASRRANWEAVLWHEYAHVITLALTRNRMPRWLSEGISVYEETRADPAWGQRMSIPWHRRISSGKLRPISGMSAAFLDAQSGEDTQFAYFQSYLVVRFLIENHGFERLRSMLARLADGTEANTALREAYGPLDALDTAFADYAAGAAQAFAAGLSLAEPANPATRLLATLTPNHYPTMLQRARTAMLARDWATARVELERLTDGDRYFPGDDSPHRLLARVYRELGDTGAERAVLDEIVRNEADALEPVVRLHELAEAQGEAAGVIAAAERWLAIQPLAEAPWRSLLAAHETGGSPAAAARAGTSLLALEPPDRAAIHHRIARQLRTIDRAGARRHVLLALEEAPRFRAAHELLAELPGTEDTR